MTEEEREPEKKQDESGALASDGDLVELAKAVDRSFPNLKCLRCGSESFFLAGPASHIFRGDAGGGDRGADREKFGIEALDLICQRCGMIERHSVEILQRAAKPIKAD